MYACVWWLVVRLLWLCFFDGARETYDDTFFEALDGVTNALDNVDASKSIMYIATIGYCVKDIIYYRMLC